MLADSRVHTTLPVSDLQRARTFYEETLGLSPAFELPGGAFYDCGDGTRFAISRSGGAAAGSHTQMAFVVDDIVSEVVLLRERGVEFVEYDLPTLRTVDGIADTGALRAAWFNDPEGNLLAIMQPASPLPPPAG